MSSNDKYNNSGISHKKYDDMPCYSSKKMNEYLPKYKDNHKAEENLMQLIPNRFIQPHNAPTRSSYMPKYYESLFTNIVYPPSHPMYKAHEKRETNSWDRSSDASSSSSSSKKDDGYWSSR